MERLVAKYEQRYRRAKEELAKWEGQQAKLMDLIGAAAAVLGRLPVLAKQENYGALGEVEGMAQDLVAKQVESLEAIFKSMHATLQEMERVSRALERLWRDACNLFRAEKPQPSKQQFHQRLGARPSLNDCVGGLQSLYTMHRDEYRLKLAIVSALSYNSRPDDVTRLAAVLDDQPNIAPDEVQMILSLVICED